MIKAGNDIDGWHTGGAYGKKSVIDGKGDFSSLQLDFPHTYLGGNPFICSGGTTSNDSTDSSPPPVTQPGRFGSPTTTMPMIRIPSSTN